MEFVREFLCGVLNAAGGVVEIEAAGDLHVLLPPEMGVDLGLGEEIRIALSDRQHEERHGVDGRLGSPLLERLVTQRLAAPPLAAVGLPPELPRPLPAQIPVLLNAVRAGDATRSRAVERYLLADLRLVVLSDEVRSAMATVCLRLADGAYVTPPPLQQAEPRALRPLDDAERRRVRRALHGWIRRESPVRLAGALAAVQRRVRRDLDRMAEYYTSLDAEMAVAVRRARVPEERERRQAKRAALAEDLAARRAQLRERTRPRLSAALVAATLVETDVERFELPVRRRTRNGLVMVRGRAADSVFEGPACAVCSEASLRLYLCDEQLHVLCPGCGQDGRLDAARCGGCRRAAVEPLTLIVDDPTAALRLSGTPLRSE